MAMFINVFYLRFITYIYSLLYLILLTRGVLLCHVSLIHYSYTDNYLLL